MILDTHTEASLESSICKYFQITQEELHSLFDKIYCSPREVEIEISDYVSETFSDVLDQVQFYHLSRRLNDSDLKDCNNLYDVLLKRTPISKFLKKHGIEFRMGDGHLLLYHNGRLEELKQTANGNINYLKWRMGYDNGDEDYCVNGFALRDLLHHNDYYDSLCFCPEFISQLAEVLNKEQLMWEYWENSKYYCLEYLIPLDRVIIDGKEYIFTKSGKSKVLLEAAMLRLYKLWLNKKYTFDHENVILRLADTDSMQEEYFVRAVKLE